MKFLSCQELETEMNGNTCFIWFKRVFQFMFPKPLIYSFSKLILNPGPTMQTVELFFCSILINSNRQQCTKAQENPSSLEYSVGHWDQTTIARKLGENLLQTF